MTKSFAVSALIILCIAMAESAILSNIAILPAVPDLMLISSLYFSLVNGRGYGEAAGFLSGLALDFLSGAPFGFNCIFRTIIGYAAGFFSASLNYGGVFIPCMIGLCGTLAKAVLVWLIALFFPAVPLAYHVFSVPFAFELAANIVLTPFVFRLLGSFRYAIALHDGDAL